MKNLLWLDLETTGLDPALDDILMVGVARTDEAGVIIESGEWVVDSNIRNSELDPVILKMHTENGLLDRVRSREAKPVLAVELHLLEFIGGSKPTLAGNNIGFDCGFIREHMRGVYAALEYRTGGIRKLDVSMLRRAARAWGLPDYPKTKAHLALDDVKASIAEFLHWKKAFGR